jgi:hypothetical protein
MSLRFIYSLQLSKSMRKGCKLYAILALNEYGKCIIENMIGIEIPIVKLQKNQWIILSTDVDFGTNQNR